MDKGGDWLRLKAVVLDSVSSPITKRVYNLGLDEPGTARNCALHQIPRDLVQPIPTLVTALAPFAMPPSAAS